MCIINFLKLFCPKIYCYFSSFLKSTKVAEYCLYIKISKFHRLSTLRDLTSDDKRYSSADTPPRFHSTKMKSLDGTRETKGTHVGLHQLQIGVFDAVAHFNEGSEAREAVSKTGNVSWHEHAER